MKKVLVYGSKEFGQVVKDLVIDCGHDFCGFIDDHCSGNEIIGDLEFVKSNYSNDQYYVVIAVGYKDLKARWQVYEKVKKAGFKVLTLIHPTAYLKDKDAIGAGSIIMAGAIIDTRVKVSDLNVFWPGVVINHDSIIESNSFFSPNSTVCGCCKIGNNCFIGAGAVIVDHINVPDNSFIKANSTYYER